MGKSAPFCRLTNEETEKLICMIEKHPELYNAKLTDYHNRVFISNLFAKIAKDIKIDGITGNQISYYFMFICIPSYHNNAH